jgi:hypothetical protein
MVAMIVKQQMVKKVVTLKVVLMHVMIGAEEALETGEVCVYIPYTITLCAYLYSMRYYLLSLSLLQLLAVALSVQCVHALFVY